MDIDIDFHSPTQEIKDRSAPLISVRLADNSPERFEWRIGQRMIGDDWLKPQVLKLMFPPDGFSTTYGTLEDNLI